MRTSAILAFILVLGGCVSGADLQTDSQKLAAAEISFTSAVDELTFNCDAKIIPRVRCEELAVYVTIGSNALEMAQLNVLEEAPVSRQIETMRNVIRLIGAE